MSVDATPAVVAQDALDGLWADPPRLPTKWLYDARGSKIFDEITRLPEYYPTRRETAILRDSAPEIIAKAGASTLIELGSGTSTKTRLLLDALGAGATYTPVDVSTEMLQTSANILADDYPKLTITPIEADFTEALRFPSADGPRLVAFLGGTIGNFDDDERMAFYRRLADALAPGDALLLGTDLIKNTGRLTAAYNDQNGVTADFNRNMIEVLRTDFDASGLYADDFDHIARWNPARHRIEMWLRARRDIDVSFPAVQKDWHLDSGKEVLTEISVKFSPEMVAAELSDAGFTVSDTWGDPAGDFLLTLARREG